MATLEIGCGNYRCKNVDVAIDIDPSVGCDYVMDAADLKFPDNSFSKVITHEVLGCVWDPYKVFSEICRVLKPKGVVEITVPNVYYWRSVVRWFLKGERASHGVHLFCWTQAEITHLLEAVGFKILNVSFTTFTHLHGRSMVSNILPRVTKRSLVIVARKAN